MKSESLSPHAQHVQDELRRLGFANVVIEHEQSTRTAQDAADALGCTVAQIAKSLIFRTRAGQRPLLVIASGVNRVSEERLAAAVGEPIEKGDADFVRETTGYAVGGVAPLGHSQPLETYIDEDLLQYAEIWAAAGTPNAVFRLTPAELLRMTGGTRLAVKRA